MQAQQWKTTLVVLCGVIGAPAFAQTAPSADPVSVNVNGAGLTARYRLQTDHDGNVVNNQIQDQGLFDVTVSFWGSKVRLDFQAATGNNFTSIWDNSPIGKSAANYDFNLRRFSLTLKPQQSIELGVGSMAPYYGAGTDNTSFHGDGYLMGYRAKVKIENGDLVVTTGYVADYDSPSVFDRFHRLDEFDYVQAMITQQIGAIVRSSLEFSRFSGEDYIRGAFSFDLKKWTKFLDNATVEDMTRVASDTSYDDAGTVLSVKLAKKYADLFDGRDLTASITDTYRSESLKNYKLQDRVFTGQSVRVTVGVPNLLLVGKVGGKKTNLGTSVDYVQSITNRKMHRLEIGMSVKM